MRWLLTDDLLNVTVMYAQKQLQVVNIDVLESLMRAAGATRTVAVAVVVYTSVGWHCPGVLSSFIHSFPSIRLAIH